MPVLRHNARSLAAVAAVLLACTLCAHARQREADEVQRLFLPEMNSALDLDLRDPAFRRCKDEPRFREAVKALKKKYKR
ncbi:MAG TPA: hypothetical protein VF621_17610 [Pyrinomonadaceae bacterium]|jgi:hypothetical protein